MRRTLAGISLMALLLASTLGSAQSWLQGHSDGFQVNTDGGDSSTREALFRLEQERVVVAQVLHKPRLASMSIIQITAVRDVEVLRKTVPEFPADVLQRSAASFVGLERARVFFQQPQQWESATRAVASILLSVNYPRTPKWFDLGFARYIGSMQIAKEQIEVGRPPSDDRRGEGWIRIADVMSTDRESDPQWQHESWLLVHWLVTNSRLSEAGRYFSLTMNQQVPVRDAILRAFSEDAATLDHDLQIYDAETAQHPQLQRVPVANIANMSSYEVRKLPALEAQIALGTAMLDDRDRPESLATAMKQLSSIMHNAPDNVSAQRALAYGYLLQHDSINAVEHARRAIDLEDKDPLMHYILAVGLNGGDTAAIQTNMAAVRLGNELNAALRLGPEFAPAWELRGLALMSSDKPTAGLKDLGHAAALRPREDSYLLHLGEAQAANGDWDNARILFAMVKDSPDNDVAQAATEQLKTGRRIKKEQKHWNEQGISAGSYQDQTDPRWKPTPEMEAKAHGENQENAPAGPDLRKIQHLDGELVSVDCSSDPGAILTVNARGIAWKMKVLDRKTVLLIGPDRFSCLWKQKKVSVNYKGSGGVTGDVVSIELE